MGILDDAKGAIPDVGLNVESIVSGLTIFFIIVFLGIVASVILFWYMSGKKYNKRIVIFENVDGQFKVTRKEWAAEIRLGASGDTIFYWRGAKAHRPPGLLQTGPNIFWYFKRSDGEYINFGLEDLNQKMREMGANFLTQEVRYARTGLQKNLKDSYDKPKWWEKHGAMVLFMGMIIVFGFSMWFAFDKFVEVISTQSQLTDKIAAFMDQSNDLLSKLDNIQGGSGVQPAG